MKTIFDKTTRDELIERIHAIHENRTAKWGKMNVYQMLRHCTLWQEWILGRNQTGKYTQTFIGRLFGKMALRSTLKNASPMRKGVPSSAEHLTKETNGNIASEKSKWISLIEEFEHYDNPAFVHDFFGKMTKEEIGCFVYKHNDHHLRQFGC